MKKFKNMHKVLLSFILTTVITSNCMVIAYADTGSTSSNDRSKISESLEDVMSDKSKDETIPVCIWYNDIDQKSLDEEAQKKTGFAVDKLSVQYTDTDIQTANDLNTYIKKTEKSRQLEKEKTDSYITTRRKLSKEKYNKAADKLLKKISVSDDSVIFESQYAPMIIANLTSKSIDKISKYEIVDSIEYYVEPEIAVCTAESIKNTTNYADMVSELNLSGEGVKIGMIESGVPEEHSEINSENVHNVGEVSYSDHATNSARIIIGSENGFAPNAELYATDATFSNIETMLTYGVQLINVSFGWMISESDTSDYYAETSYDKWFNHIVSYHNVTVIASAGNDGQGTTLSNGYLYKRVLSPAMAHNVIAVGAYNDMGTENTSDDIMYDYSSYKNGNGDAVGVQKPEVIMPGNILGGGTSSSAPVLTGTVALMFELKPSLAAFPQAVKAIIMSSCHRKVRAYGSDSPELISYGITDKQGAGAPDAMIMANIICQGTYGVGTISGEETSDIRRFKQPKYGATNMNITVSWLKNGNSDNGENTTSEDYIDLDLSVYCDESTIASSALEYSSSEMSYITCRDSGNYKIEVEKYTTDYTGTVKYGYAYSTNNHYFSEMTNEGIYYLKNSQGTYLTLDPTDNSLSLETFTGDTTQQWIIKEEVDYGMGIYPAYESVSGGIGLGEAFVSWGNYAVLNETIYPMELFNFEDTGRIDGATYFYSLRSGGILRGSTLVMHASNAEPTAEELWYPEKVGYRLGDVNMDGILNNDDVTSIQRYIVDGETYNNLQTFLADTNNDNDVNVKDAIVVMRAIQE